ncbi:alpha/beta hydrolase [Roseimaritima ulvae]|uniref:Alpha/beta-hydrolase family protein n=1 Tax=Roseimaritima ulvae TaxID=980254 RepID=A0A5B9QKG6_9BACT|nr:alpha/beta-hydrolase family protein [Roseimaritima ulvae]QEG39558.1 hypothetical protein UC8_15530 [Roseimaritima ulvae]
MVHWLRRLPASFSPAATAVGLLFFSASLTPSLLPRPPLMQGLLGGISLFVGYAIGVALIALWRFMQLRELVPKNAHRIRIGFLAVPGVVALITLTQMTVWQNSIRVRMQMPDVDSSYPMRVFLIAVLVAIVLLLAGRGIGFLVRVFSHWLTHVMPPRVAFVVSVLVLSIVGFNLVNGLIVRTALRALDETFAAIDHAVDTELAEPTAATASGSSESLINWSEIGKNGKRFVAAGPTAADISQLTGRPAKPPLRVYAGYNTRDSLQERAEVAVEELIRVGGFERKVLIVATPTGTGWLDPSAVDPLEYLHDGDIATVSMQYSYLPSWLTIMVDPDRSRHSAEALFNEVYAHWTALPAETRPRLYLFGLSLGSLGSEAALDFYDLISDPIDGAVLSGPPFPSTMWPELVRNRKPGTPAWLPEFRQSDLVRFMNHEGSSTPTGTPWGAMRIMYLQHGSDPMAWFSPSLAWHKPDWLVGEKAPDVSPHFRWFPLVTFLQVGFDVPMATSAPIGYAHNYSPAEYIDAWIDVTAPQAWSAADTEALKAAYADFDPSPLSN